MIHVTIYKSVKHDYMGFCANGHAGMADEGQDIVCAAASILMINTTNAIEKYTKDEFTRVYDEVEGRILFELKQKPSEETNLLLKTMFLGLRSMYDEYEEYINLSIEEV